jgi:hypothetical protein
MPKYGPVADSNIARATALLDDVVSAGVQQGLWKPGPPVSGNHKGERMHEEWNARRRNVIDGAGWHYSIWAGEHDQNGKIGADIKPLEGIKHTFKVFAPDSRGPKAPKPDVPYASADRGAAAVAKDLARRMVGSEEAQAYARAMVQTVEKRRAMRAELEDVCQRMRDAGFEVEELGADDYYDFKAWTSGPISGVRITSDGKISMDRVELRIEHIPAFMELVGLLPEEFACDES